MSLTIKDPGSALTHFIGMLLAILASVPLLALAASRDGQNAVLAFAIFACSMILLYGASTTYHTFNISEKVNRILRKIDHMMIFILIAGSYTPICVIGSGMGHCHHRHADQSILDHLPEMVLLHDLYFHGLALCPGHGTAGTVPPQSSLCMAGCRRCHLHHRRNYLRIETSDLQFQTPVLWIS